MTKEKKQTIAQVAESSTFEGIYSEMSGKRLELDIVNKDIGELQRKANGLKSEVNHLNQIALAKRRALVNKA